MCATLDSSYIHFHDGCLLLTGEGKNCIWDVAGNKDCQLDTTFIIEYNWESVHMSSWYARSLVCTLIGTWTKLASFLGSPHMYTESGRKWWSMETRLGQSYISLAGHSHEGRESSQIPIRQNYHG